MGTRVMIFGMLMACSAPSIVAQVTDTESSDASIIIVTGYASESIPPDGVTVQFLVSSLEDEPGSAADETDTKANAVVNAVQALGISDLAISRIGYGVGPDWDRTTSGQRRLRGYVARVTIRVKTGFLDATGRIVEAGISSGASEIRGIEYSSSRMDESRRTALRAAVRAARSDAVAMAEAAGGTLGRLLLLTTEKSDRPPGVRLEALTVGAGGSQITPEDLTVSARVESHWLFLGSPISESR